MQVSSKIFCQDISQDYKNESFDFASKVGKENLINIEWGSK